MWRHKPSHRLVSLHLDHSVTYLPVVVNQVGAAFAGGARAGAGDARVVTVVAGAFDFAVIRSSHGLARGRFYSTRGKGRSLG